MDYNEKLAWLRRYQISLKQEKAMLLEIEQLRAEAERVTPALSGMPSGPGDGQAMPRAVERIVEAQIRMADQVAVDQALCTEIKAAIQTVGPPMEREILNRRYIRGQSWERIAADLERSLSWTLHIHHDAVEHLRI